MRESIYDLGWEIIVLNSLKIKKRPECNRSFFYPSLRQQVTIQKTSWQYAFQ